MTRTLIAWAVPAFAAYYLLTDPSGAASILPGILGGLQHGASSLASFVSHV